LGYLTRLIGEKKDGQTTRRLEVNTYTNSEDVLEESDRIFVEKVKDLAIEHLKSKLERMKKEAEEKK
jgi:hypothetical protein